jgi:Fungal specific transcription factor domain
MNSDTTIQNGGCFPSKTKGIRNLLNTFLVPLAMSDVAVFHAILCSAGLALEKRRAYSKGRSNLLVHRHMENQMIPPHFLHKTEAIRLINERLQDPIESSSDGTLTAVLYMAQYEVRCDPSISPMFLTEILGRQTLQKDSQLREFSAFIPIPYEILKNVYRLA